MWSVATFLVVVRSVQADAAVHQPDLEPAPPGERVDAPRCHRVFLQSRRGRVLLHRPLVRTKTPSHPLQQDGCAVLQRKAQRLRGDPEKVVDCSVEVGLDATHSYDPGSIRRLLLDGT